MSFIPSYIELFKSGELKRRAEAAEKILDECTVCPRKCKINRRNSPAGYCHSGFYPIVSSYTAHFGEEPCLSGTREQEIFFSGTAIFAAYSARTMK